jgi:4-hydroxybenzoate polyprenyltransferase
MSALMDLKVESAGAQEHVPLVVDLDGTLLRTDTLIESVCVLARNAPLKLFRLPFWWMRGRAYLKHQLAELALPDIHWLPQRHDVVEFLLAQKRLGRPLILATASDATLAQQINADLGLFDSVFASDGHTNLFGERKRDRLIAAFGPRGFDYIANADADYCIWQAARRALLVSPSARLAHKVAAVTPVDAVFREPLARWRDYLHAMRPNHWVKNILLLVPLAAAHRLFELDQLWRVILAFIAFNLCASGLYLFNDLLDLPADRRHPTKSERMLASGRIRIASAIALMGVLLIASFAIACHLATSVAVVLLLYSGLMVGYSMSWKAIPLVDVLVLAGGYALRVAAGAAATNIRLSAWLLTFCVFLFFSLALIKRYAELVIFENLPGGGPVRARGYVGSDKVMLLAEGIASGYLAVMVLALYTNTAIAQQLYVRHDFFWGVCLALFFWVSYLWMAAVRGRIVGDPVMFALTDRGSQVAIAVMGLFALLAI